MSRSVLPSSAPEPALFRDCPAVALLHSVSSRWVTQVIGALGELGELGTLRYGQLSRRIPGASQKMLTQTLRGLERDGIVTRKVTSAVPARVDYELTALGVELYELLLQVKAWAEKNVERVDAARCHYDARDDLAVR
jgi:DNA-binding HxlR family transcriptional regulator